MRFASVLALGLCLVAVSCAAPARTVEDPKLAALTSDRLETFASEAEFLAYVRAAKAEARARGFYWSRVDGAVLAQNEENPCPTPEDCPPESDADSITVTGSRVSGRASFSAASPAPPASTSSTSSITNVQTIGVDEGDIVKQVGQFLIVLQDGRLFSVDMGDGRLALVDRENVYRRRNADTWYDEMLAYQNRIVVTGYSYQHGASEIAVFALSPRGELQHETTYYISSHDYYDGDNYATRLVGDTLVVYTPLALAAVDPDHPMEWPLVRRWVRADMRSGQDVLTKGARLFDARTIHKPLQETLQPVVHTVAMCSLGAVGPGDEMECRTQGFVGPGDREFYVSPQDVYLWITARHEIRDWSAHRRDCDKAREAGQGTAPPEAMLVKVPLAGGAPLALFTRGRPQDQFGMASTDTEFRALLTWWDATCGADSENASVRYFSAPLSAFATRPVEAQAQRYIEAPGLDTMHFENRFTDDYVVYGGRNSWGTYAPYYMQRDAKAQPLTARVVAIPLDRPREASVLAAPHNIIRAERAGNNIVVTGYRDASGLSVTVVDLSRAPRISDTEVLARRFESEGRSHAFNSLISADESGIMGLPTVLRADESGRYVWRSDASDVSFLSVTADGTLRSIGALLGRENSVHPSYRCEVSCIDWYGNTRPIFTEGRIFGLSGTELIEGALGEGQINEVRRLNLTAPRGGPIASK